MKHLYELPPTTIRLALTGPFLITEKLDGSYLRAGFDDYGKFYTLRKGTKRCYDVNDWPDLAWTNNFRSAHLALIQFMDYLTHFAPKVVEPGFWIDVELLNGQMPNSVDYGPLIRDTIVVFDCSIPIEEIKNEHAGSLFDRNENTKHLDHIHVGSYHWVSDDGLTQRKELKTISWAVTTRFYHAMTGNTFNNDPNSIIALFDEPTMIAGHKTNNFNVLNVNLTKRPEFIPDWDWDLRRKEIVAELKERREMLRGVLEYRYNEMSHLIKLRMAAIYRFRNPETFEGAVASCLINGEIVRFKFVDKTHFAGLNNFTHIVRYWLQGGRRPERPSFMSRTANWSIEARLARLEVLRKRFIENSGRLLHTTRYGVIDYDQPDLKQRTLVLFAELRKRIEDGRNGIQGSSSPDSQGGDSTHTEVALAEVSD